jgi:hypothetical protein
MPDTDVNAVSSLLQKVYDGDPVSNVFDMEMSDPFRTHCEIENNAGGENVNFEVIGAGTVLVSPDYALAGGAIETFRFSVEPISYHLRATITRDALDKVKGKGSKALLNVSKTAMDMALYEAWRKFDRHAAAKRGELGIITGISGSTVTIGRVAGTADGWITNRLKPKQVHVAAATPGTGTLRGSDPGDEEIVLSWNDTTGVITYTNAVSGNWVIGDTLFEKGDAYFTQTLKNGRRNITGVPGWLDETAASAAESFYGKDRSTAPYDLEPMRIAVTSGHTARKALVRAMTRASGQRGISCTIGFLPTPVMEKLLLEEDSRTIVVEKQAQGKKIEIKLSGVSIDNGAGGMCEFFGWPYLASDFGYIGNHKQAPFKIMYTDRMVRLHEDGQGLWRRVEGGVTDSSTSEKVPALRAEGDLRVLLICKGPSRWSVLSNLSNLAEPV